MNSPNNETIPSGYLLLPNQPPITEIFVIYNLIVDQAGLRGISQTAQAVAKAVD